MYFYGVLYNNIFHFSIKMGLYIQYIYSTSNFVTFKESMYLIYSS